MATPFPNRGFLPFANPVSEWVDPRRNALMGFSAGMLSGDPGNAMTGAMQGSMLDQQYAEKQAEEAKAEEMRKLYAETLSGWGGEYADLADAVLAGGIEPADAYMTAWERRYAPKAGGDNLMSVGGHIYDKASGQWISPPESAENRQNVSLTPQWAQDAEGNWVMLQTSSTGELVQSQMPEGLTLADPRMLNAEKSAGTTFGKSVAGAQFDLPSAQLTRDQTLQAIQDVRNQRQGMEEQFGNVMGIPQQMTPAWPGSPKANFQVTVERATNRAFMEARQMLKGGGQITDFESRKAEAAITAMQSAMEKGDKALFLQSLDDFERAVSDGYAKLEQQAGMLPQTARQPVMAPASASGNGWTVIGVE